MKLYTIAIVHYSDLIIKNRNEVELFIIYIACNENEKNGSCDESTKWLIQNETLNEALLESLKRLRRKPEIAMWS